MKRRNTLQKNLILKSLKELNHPTAEELYIEVKKELSSISRATVYRNLNDMEESGCVKKINVKPDKYDVFCSHHYHFLCKDCGSVFDVPLDYLSELDKNNFSGLEVVEHEIIFKGVCANCKK